MTSIKKISLSLMSLRTKYAMCCTARKLPTYREITPIGFKIVVLITKHSDPRIFVRCCVIVHCLLFYLCKMGLHLSFSAVWAVLRYIVCGHDIGKIRAQDASDEARAHS